MKNILHILNKLFLLVLLITAAFYINNSYSQSGAAINTSGATADPSAMLDISSTNSGVLITRMTTAERNNIATPIATGLLIYNTDCNIFEYYNGLQWITLNNMNVSVNISATPAGVVCAGTNIVFTANTVNGGSAPLYLWRVNGIDIGSNSNTFSSSTLSNGDVVSCEVLSNELCVNGNLAFSNTIIAFITPIPAILNYNDGYFCGIGTTTLGATASGGIINWYSDSTGGLLMGTGNTFVTPVISSSTAYYAEAVANNCYSVTRFPVNAIKETFSPGDTYGGGIIGYLDATGCNGLIAAPFDQSTSAEWGCLGTLIGGTSWLIGSGQANTAIITGACVTSSIAAKLSESLVLNGYSDWYLPSIDELEHLYYNMTAIGLNAGSYYWSSSEDSADRAYLWRTDVGYKSNRAKNQLHRVRAVRTFIY